MKLISWLKAIWDMPWYLPLVLVFAVSWIRSKDIGDALFFTVAVFIGDLVIIGLILLVVRIVHYVKRKGGVKK